ncbi:mechanosensitive ion channel family protein [Croceibacterium mercuriale]|uniref:mechanosensitive ion channel family protein n=1 Tax=Croceibacterium mercuriale TaxID=1572751 RepID=UPI000A47890B|nr:mechanosensitive ion channel family protein [Croceibacterium mercuriale]
MSLRLLTQLLAVLLVLLPAHAYAQDADAAAEEAVAAIADPYDRLTPRSSVTALLNALGEGDYNRAAQYLTVPLETDAQRARASTLTQRLRTLLDSGGTLQPFGNLSNDPTGRTDDGLALEQEQVGSVPIGGNQVPIVLVRSAVEEGGTVQVWRVAPEVVAQLATREVAQVAAEAAPSEDGFMLAGAPLADWALLIGAALALFGGLYVIARLLLTVAKRVISEPQTSLLYRALNAALPPVSLLVAGGMFYVWAEQLPASIVARQLLLRYTGVVALIALVWFGLRLVNAVSDLTIARMQRHERRQVISVVSLLRRVVKIILLAFVFIAVLDTFGIDVTTGVAALGIGGIALALGAQKTVENLVGSVTVIVDKPAQVGDFVKVGTVVGTVEDVGIRSTRIRTNDRTIVTIPNGDLSSQQIENYSVRERFLFNPLIGIEYGLPAAKVREAVQIVAEVLEAHEKVAEGSRARLKDFGASSLDIEVFSYIDVPDFAESLIHREELLLTILERFENAGIGIAFPTRTIVFGNDLPVAKSGGGGDPADPANDG